MLAVVSARPPVTPARSPVRLSTSPSRPARPIDDVGCPAETGPVVEMEDGLAGRSLPAGTWVVLGAFAISGTVHLVRPQVFEPLVPRILPAPRATVLVSGVAELACALGLASRQPWAPGASAALLLGVWPGNWTMALAWQRSPRRGRPAKALAWARLPVQVPLVIWALRSPTS